MDATNMVSHKHIISERNHCISCGSADLSRLSGGGFNETPVREFIENDPWGESPLAYLEDEQWEFVICKSCDQKFHRRILSKEYEDILFTKWMSKEAIDEFEARIEKYAPQNVFSRTQQEMKHVHRLYNLSKNLRGKEALRLLDFGCGWGTFLSLASLFGIESYGVDVDPDRRSAAGALGVKVVTQISELPQDLAKRFHAITLFQVLEHLPDPLSILCELSRYVCPGGVLVLETPNCANVTKIETGRDYRAINPLSHINGFTEKSLINIAKQAGFERITAPTVGLSCSIKDSLKTEVRRSLGSFYPTNTNQYFRKI